MGLLPGARHAVVGGCVVILHVDDHERDAIALRQVDGGDQAAISFNPWCMALPNLVVLEEEADAGQDHEHGGQDR